MLSDGLKKARELFLSGACRVGGVYLVHDSLETAGLHGDVLADSVELLDSLAPGGNFHFWGNGGVWEENPSTGDLEPVYYYDRKPSEIAAVFGRAILRARAEEGAR